jgi:hypothetical protein
MFQAPIYSSSGATVYITISIFCVCYVGWLLARLECNRKQIVHLVCPYTSITMHGQQNIKLFSTSRRFCIKTKGKLNFVNTVQDSLTNRQEHR